MDRKRMEKRQICLENLFLDMIGIDPLWPQQNLTEPKSKLVQKHSIQIQTCFICVRRTSQGALRSCCEWRPQNFWSRASFESVECWNWMNVADTLAFVLWEVRQRLPKRRLVFTGWDDWVHSHTLVVEDLSGVVKSLHVVGKQSWPLQFFWFDLTILCKKISQCFVQECPREATWSEQRQLEQELQEALEFRTFHDTCTSVNLCRVVHRSAFRWNIPPTESSSVEQLSRARLTLVSQVERCLSAVTSTLAQHSAARRQQQAASCQILSHSVFSEAKLFVLDDRSLMLMHACGLFGNAWIVRSPRVYGVYGGWAVLGGETSQPEKHLVSSFAGLQQSVDLELRPLMPYDLSAWQVWAR